MEPTLVPQAAFDAADLVYGVDSDDDAERLENALKAAAPAIVAAELRRLAVADESIEHLTESAIRHLLARANELCPEDR